MPLIRTLSGREFQQERGESLLAAAQRHGLTLPYSCRTGRCSTCKCRVVEGVTRAVSEESGLSADERQQGWILGCVRSALDDVVIEVEDLADLNLPTARTLPCRIDTLQRLAPDVVEVTLRLPPTARFDFRPGQYIDVLGPSGVRRSYSLAAAPTADGRLTLQVREVPGGLFSRYWFGSAKPGDLLRLHGPLGTCVLSRISGRDLIFLATGTGIAPIRAMLQGMAGDCGKPGQSPTSVVSAANVSLPLAASPRFSGHPATVRVYWGGRQPADLYCDVEALAPGQITIPVLSRALADWPGRRGYVQQALLEDLPALDNALVYACGNERMIESARTALLSAGLPTSRFHADAFVCSAPTTSENTA